MKYSYYSFREYLENRFQANVRRLSINAGFSCPNRDGSLDTEGCFFCNEKGFSLFSQTDKPLKEQIIASMDLLRQRYKTQKFIAYFQNASNTYAGIEKLKMVFDTIRSFNDIVGLIISTRPDCVDAEKLALISEYCAEYEVWIEYGLQSIHDKTLDLVNRRHNSAQFLDAVRLTKKTKINIGVHVILGLPGETRQDMIETAKILAELGVKGVKIHVFHILRDTRFQALYEQGQIALMEEKEYVRAVCDFLEHLRPDCVIMRLVSTAREDILIAPQWINQRQKVLADINNEFLRRKSNQGSRA
ncbi:MAG: TIGR01212 family radical SAM protein [Candidatus Omnitrophica bacterium]|nr:TIGR01212 family radical SAM protein [Candidatus Omnitrophota bacterium]